MNPYTARPPISPDKIRPTRSAPSVRWPPCSPTVSVCKMKPPRWKPPSLRSSIVARSLPTCDPAAHPPPPNRSVKRCAPPSAERGTYRSPALSQLPRVNTFMPRTIIEKLWDSHVVHELPGAPTLLFIDLHLVHEVTSPQAFRRLRV